MTQQRELRLQIMLTEAELRAVDNFRFNFRLPSRAASVRELLNRGLHAESKGSASENSRSKDFGVLENPNNSSFNGVDEDGKFLENGTTRHKKFVTS